MITTYDQTEIAIEYLTSKLERLPETEETYHDRFLLSLCRSVIKDLLAENNQLKKKVEMSFEYAHVGERLITLICEAKDMFFHD